MFVISHLHSSFHRGFLTNAGLPVSSSFSALFPIAKCDGAGTKRISYQTSTLCKAPFLCEQLENLIIANNHVLAILE